MILPKTKIALLNSPYLLNEPFYQHMPPLALLYLASYMEQCNFDPMIFNIESCVNDNGIYIIRLVICKAKILLYPRGDLHWNSY